VTAAILGQLMPREEIRVDEPRHQLRDRRPGHTRAPRELRTRHALGGDRAQREELRDGQRGVMRSEQALDPPADQRRD
jgi:predicted kinase